MPIAPMAAAVLSPGNQTGCRRLSALGVFLEVLDRVANGQNRFRCIVWNFAAELFLESHDEFDRVETVGAKIVDEACVLCHFLGFDTQMLHHNLLNPLDNITHRSNLCVSDWVRSAMRPKPMASSRTRRKVAWSRVDHATYPPTKICPSRAWVRLTYFIGIDQRCGRAPKAYCGR